MHNEKYKEIETKIAKLKEKKPHDPVITNSNMAFNIAVELVAGVIAGVIIGFFFDKLFDSKPVFLIICIMLAIVAAFRSIWNKYIKNNGS